MWCVSLSPCRWNYWVQMYTAAWRTGCPCGYSGPPVFRSTYIVISHIIRAYVWPICIYAVYTVLNILIIISKLLFCVYERRHTQTLAMFITLQNIYQYGIYVLDLESSYITSFVCGETTLKRLGERYNFLEKTYTILLKWTYMMRKGAVRYVHTL